MATINHISTIIKPALSPDHIIPFSNFKVILLYLFHELTILYSPITIYSQIPCFRDNFIHLNGCGADTSACGTQLAYPVSRFMMYLTGQMNILQHDHHPLCMYGTQDCIFKKVYQVGRSNTSLQIVYSVACNKLYGS